MCLTSVVKRSHETESDATRPVTHSQASGTRFRRPVIELAIEGNALRVRGARREVRGARLQVNGVALQASGSPSLGDSVSA